mgnify:FL=1
MEKRPRSSWLSLQGYNERTLPLKAQWYGKRGNAFMGRTDDYSLPLYREKGYVLDKQYLEPEMWQFLEYRQDGITIDPPTFRIRPSQLVREVLNAFGGRTSWEGSSSDLATMLDTTRSGVPRTPKVLSEKIREPETRAALASYGILVDRRRANGKRLITLTRTTG